MTDENAQLPATLILEFLRGLKDDIHNLRKEMLERFEQVDKRFEQVDKRFEQVDKRFEHLERRMDRMEDALRDDRRKLNEVYETRDHVKITFGWQWGLISLFIAVIAAGITKVFN